MASSTLPQPVSGDEFDNNDDDEDDDGAVANSHDGRSTASQDAGGVRPLGVRRCAPQSRAADPGRSRRAAVTQYQGQRQPSVVILEEERTTDDEDDVLGSSSAETATAQVDDGLPRYVVKYPKGVNCDRLRHQRMSLLGKPLNYRMSRRETRIRRLQSLIYNFLERPKTCAAITYHTSV